MEITARQRYVVDFLFNVTYFFYILCDICNWVFSPFQRLIRDPLMLLFTLRWS